MTEATIMINGHSLTYSQSMALRCALESFAEALKDGCLGDDELGQEMAKAYDARISEIRRMMMK